MTLTLALQLAIAGISVGSIYALVALAIVIPFKSSGVLNFGQGEIVTLGAYIALILTQLALPYPVVVASGVIWFLRSTRLGKAMRAASVNPEAARLMGIRVETVYRWSWAISTAIGALAGLLFAPLIGINPEIGQLILRGLLAAVIGGFTSIPGAIVGGLAVGLIETFSGVLIGSTFKNLVPFILLMVLLVFRPQGLFGAAEIKRV